MPYPDAKYPPAKVESDRMRWALRAIKNDCRTNLAENRPAGDVKGHLLPAIWDCARTALGEGTQ